MKAKIISLILCAVLSGSGCATIMSGNQQTVPVTSNPPGATVTTGNGQTITTPGAVVLSTKETHMLVAEYPGRETQQRPLLKKLNKWVICDPLWDFGIISLPIDFISGSANELHPKSVHFSFPPPGTKLPTAQSLLGLHPNLTEELKTP